MFLSSDMSAQRSNQREEIMIVTWESYNSRILVYIKILRNVNSESLHSWDKEIEPRAQK